MVFKRKNSNDEMIEMLNEINKKLDVFINLKKEESRQKIENDQRLFREATDLARRNKKLSIRKLEKHLRIGYTKASILMDELEERGIVSPANGNRPREVIKCSTS